MKTYGKIMSLVLATVMCFGIVSFAGCSDKTAEAQSYMTVDINPSVEFTLDKDNKIVSVTALNDDGAVLISGTAFVGKTAEDGAKLVVELATQQGYLVKGEAIYDSVKGKVDKYIENSGIGAAVKEGKAKGVEELRKMAIAMGLDKAEAEKMDAEELIKYIGESRKETAELMSEELRQMYYKAKNSEIKIAENEAVIKAIGTVDEAYKQAVEQLDKAKEALKSAEKAVLEAYNTYFVSADSKYQQAVKAVLDAKAEYNKQKAIVAEMADSIEKQAAEAILATKKATLDAAEKTLAGMKTLAQTGVEVASTTFDKAYEAIDTIKAELPAEIKTKLEASVKDIDKAANTAKDKAFETFEKQYKPQIIAYDNMVKAAQKTQKKA